MELTTAGPERTTVGWIGTGLMGSSMCGHLLAAGYPATVTSRTRSKADALIEAGASWADTPAQVAGGSDVVFTMVGTPADVRSVILGPDGVLAGARPGTVIVDMTTSQPSLAAEIASVAASQEVASVDAPVSGGDVGARGGTLSIMAGGTREAFDAVRPCFDVMGSTVVYQGDPGAGQHTKMVNQILVAATMVGMSEALVYARKAGLDPATVLESVSTGAAGSWTLSNLAPRAVAGDFAPGFLVEHFTKDMAIALDEARSMSVFAPGLALAQQLYATATAQGHGRDGTHSLVPAMAAMSDLDW